MKTKKKDGYELTRASYIAEAGLEYLISLLITGQFLTYLLLELNFSDALTGIVSSFVTFACTAQLAALFFCGKRVKRVVTVLHIVNQLCFCFLYIIPFIPLPTAAKPLIFMAMLMLGHLISHGINPLKMNWLMGAVADHKRGSFTAIKEMASLLGGIIFSFVMGYFADTYREAGNTRGFFLVGGITVGVLMLLHTLSLLLCREKPAPASEADIPRRSFGYALRMLKQPRLLKIIGVGVLWNVTSQLSVHFFYSYQQKELEYSMTAIAIISAVGSACRILVSPFLGRYADKRSFANMMTVCFLLAAAGFFINTFTAPGPLRYLYIVYFCLYSASMGGINSGTVNLIFDYVPHSDRVAALAVKTALSGIIGFLSTLLGGVIFNAVSGMGTLPLIGRVYPQQILSFFSFLLAMVLLFYMRFVIIKIKRVQVNYEEN